MSRKFLCWIWTSPVAWVVILGTVWLLVLPLSLTGCTQYDGRELPTCSECVGGDYRPECAGRCCGGGRP